MNKRIFLSYCQANENEADKIDEEFKKNNIIPTRDKRDLKYKQNIEEFMKKIREHDFAILLISHEYLTSVNCMYEFLQVLKEKDFEKKILPLILIDNFFKDRLIKITYLDNWEEKIKELEIQIDDLWKKGKRDYTTDLIEEKKKCEKIKNEIEEIIRYLCNNFMVSFKDEEKNNFKTIFKEIGIDIQKENKKNDTIVMTEEEKIKSLFEDLMRKNTATDEDICALFPELNNKKSVEENQTKININPIKKKGSFYLTEDSILNEIFDSTKEDWNKEAYRDFFTYKHNILLTIEEKEESEREFFELWANRHPDKKAYFHEYEIKYDKTRVTSIYLVSVDGGRAYIPLPNIETNKVKDKHMKFANIIHSYPENINYEYVERSGLEIDYND